MAALGTHEAAVKLRPVQARAGPCRSTGSAVGIEEAEVPRPPSRALPARAELDLVPDVVVRAPVPLGTQKNSGVISQANEVNPPWPRP